MTKRTLGLAGVILAVALGGAAAAQGPGMPPGHPPIGPRSMQRGPGTGGGGMGCPLMMPGAQVKVEKLENGASITVTSNDPKVVSRIQKRAEIMRLTHELEQEETQNP